jgi:hypothetical protein
MLFQVSRQCPQRGERGWACTVQVIQAHQDRNRRSSLFEVRSYPGDRPRSRMQRITSGIISGEPSERLTQGPAQLEERDHLTQLVRRGCDQGKALRRGRVGGVAEEHGLADAGLSVH